MQLQQAFLPNDLAVILVPQPSSLVVYKYMTCDFIFQMDTDIYKIVVTCYSQNLVRMVRVDKKERPFGWLLYSGFPRHITQGKLIDPGSDPQIEKLFPISETSKTWRFRCQNVNVLIYGGKSAQGKELGS